MKRRPKAGSVDLVVPELIQLILAPKSHHDRKSKGEKERARRKKGGDRREKAIVALLAFIIATLEFLVGKTVRHKRSICWYRFQNSGWNIVQN